MFDYSSLETLRTVEQEGSYGRAARTLGVTRSAISQKINQLEDRWGSSITLRKPVKTTKHGARLCRHVDQVRLLESKLHLNEGGNFDAFEIEPHAIRLLYDMDLLQTGFLDELLFRVERQSDFDFELVRTNSAAIQSEIRPNTVITAISSRWVQSANFEAYNLGTQRFRAVAHPDFIRRNFSSQIDPYSFRQIVGVTYGGPSNYVERFLLQVFGQPVIAKTQQLHSNAGVLTACTNQKGWAILPEFLLGDQIQSGALIDLFPGQTLSTEAYFFISRFILEALPEVAQTVLEAAAKKLKTDTLVV